MKTYTGSYKGRSFTQFYPVINGIQVEINEAWTAEFSLSQYRLLLVDGRVVCFSGWSNLVTLAGHNWEKIDPAVPQPWLDERHFRGDRENYCWTYETAPVFGQALAYSTLIREATANIEADILQQETQDATL